MNPYQRLQYEGTVWIPPEQGIVCHIKSDFDLYFWSDQHFGANECNYALAKNIIKEIKNNPKARVVMGGDTIEAIPRGYKISERGQTTTPDLQIAKTIEHLKEIQSKIVCMFKGNHNTESRGESVDSDFLIAQALDAPYKTVPTVIQFITPKGVLKAAGGHGHSSAKNGDLELEAVRKIFPGCQIYFLGHNHMLYAKRAGALVYDSEGKEHWDEAWLVRTGNCLNYAEYARYSMYAPQRSGCIKFEIRGGKIKDGYDITEEDFK